MQHSVLFRFVIGTLLFLSLVGVGSAQTSVGLILGEPTGLSGKYWLSETASVDIALAWSFTGGGTVYIHGDYQQHFDTIPVEKGRLPLFVGLGPKLYVGSELILGIRIPVGMVYEFEEVPLEIFIEAAPGLLLFPETRFDGTGGIGIRYRL